MLLELPGLGLGTLHDYVNLMVLNPEHESKVLLSP
jgi:hypothetical protein